MTARTFDSLKLSLGGSIVLTVVKLAGGIVGHSYALVADAVESSLDIFSTVIVWGGIRMTLRPPDAEHPYGYGRAESLATMVVSFTLIGASIAIALAAISEIVTPHHAPAPFTLLIVGGVALAKEALSRYLLRTADEIGSMAIAADGWHHRSDAITSAAAFAGISVALWGGPGWESADDWAALIAAAIILRNGFALLRPAFAELMDRMPSPEVSHTISTTAVGVPGVRAIEKLRIRTVGQSYFVDIHVQADPQLTLHEAHVLSGKVKTALRRAVPTVVDALIHMEPFEPAATDETQSAHDGDRTITPRPVP